MKAKLTFKYNMKNIWSKKENYNWMKKTKKIKRNSQKV